MGGSTTYPTKTEAETDITKMSTPHASSDENGMHKLVQKRLQQLPIFARVSLTSPYSPLLPQASWLQCSQHPHEAQACTYCHAGAAGWRGSWWAGQNLCSTAGANQDHFPGQQAAGVMQSPCCQNLPLQQMLVCPSHLPAVLYWLLASYT